MNPNSYGQPSLYPPQQLQQQHPQNSEASGEVLNGNYQQKQQILNAMSALSLKQNPMTDPNVNGGNKNTLFQANNNPKIGRYIVGPNTMSTAPVMATGPKQMQVPITSMGQQFNIPRENTPDSATIEGHSRPSAFVSTARTIGNENDFSLASKHQMNVNSASIPGLPHMPPPRMATAEQLSDRMTPSRSIHQPQPENANDSSERKYSLQESSPENDQMQPLPGQRNFNLGITTEQQQFNKSPPIGPKSSQTGQTFLQSDQANLLSDQVPYKPEQRMQPSSAQMQISQSGQMFTQQAGQISSQMNVRASATGQMPPMQRQMPSQTGEQNPLVDTMAPKTGQMPIHQQTEHMPVQQKQNQMPFQPGTAGPMQYQQQQPSQMSFQSKQSGLQSQPLGQSKMPPSHEQNPIAGKAMMASNQGEQIMPPQSGQQVMTSQTTQHMVPPLHHGQQMIPPQQAQQMMSQQQAKQIMPPQQGQQTLPPQQGQQMIPTQYGQQKMPPQQGQSMMPSQQGQSMMPPQHGKSMMPPQQGQSMMPSQQGQSMMPPQQGKSMMPSQQGQSMMPPQHGKSMMPPQQGQSMMPPQQGQSMMPPQQGQQMIPPQQGQQLMPPQQGQQMMSSQQGQQMMPPQQGQQMMPPQQGQQMMPPQQGQQMMPPQQGQQMMPPQQGQQMMPPQQGQQMMPPQQGQQMMPPQQGQPMMPPQPGQQMMSTHPSQQMPNRPGFNSPGMYQQQQQQFQQPQSMPRRLDPDQMPNPIQVMVENQRNAGGIFVTNQPGLVPPLVTTKYVVQDQGNSSPRYLRSSLYCIPTTADLIKTTALPFSLIISPFARIAEEEYEPPIVDFGELGPIRCNRCKAYMSPNMQFIDAGRRFQCLMCKVSTEVPQEYFQHLDHTGQRVDKYERPELVLGTYEFIATKDYCRNNTPPEIPAFIFVIDVSYNTIKSGLVHLLCSEIKRILNHLPVDQGHEKSKVRVGFITYNSTVHFYNIKSNLAQPQMMVVGDVQDMFMPLLDGFLCHPDESEVVIDALMEQIPKMFVDTKETETILFPAIQAGLEAIKASNCCGKLLVFNSSLPIAEAPGKLKNRDDRKLLGTEKEKTVLTPQNNAYNNLGQECVQSGCSVDLFLFNNSYIDIATIGQVSRLTGGEVFKYTYFQAENDGKRLIEDIIKNVSRPIGFDAVMRVRSSQGVRATNFYGHYFMSNTTDVELASIDATKSVAIEIKHDDKLSPEENIYLQIALLYTSCSGQRRLRVLNLALRASATIADIFKSCDLDAIILFFAKQSMFKLMELSPKIVKDTLIQRTAQILACYRKHCTSPTSAGQLILPECLKLLPLYLSCLLKNDAVSGGSDMTIDDRSYVIQFVLSMDLPISVNYFYPRFIPIHNVDVDETDIPMSMRCTHDKMSEDGAYILENGVYLFIWLGQSLPQTFIQPLFGVQCTQQVNAERFAIIGDTPLARRIKQIIDSIMRERTRYMRITCVRQNDKLESIFRHFLIEDRGTDGSPNYVDFLCHMHKEIKDLLS